MEPPKHLQQAIASRIKIMSELDISERRRPQDGRIKIRVKLAERIRELDLRVSTLPTIWGEKIVMRLLDPEGLKLNLADPALKAFLRQDPNTILVGEIRDAETANIAIKAALTGHLVLSTLHTNDAPSTINRMVDMGVERFLVSSSVQLVVAQRLIRRLCKNCREVSTPDPEALVEIGLSPEEAMAVTVFHPVGCDACLGTGYKGRIALFEVMRISARLREMIVNGATNEEIRSEARSAGMITLRESGLVKIWQGVTSIEEVLRETAL